MMSSPKPFGVLVLAISLCLSSSSAAISALTSAMQMLSIKPPKAKKPSIDFAQLDANLGCKNGLRVTFDRDKAKAKLPYAMPPSDLKYPRPGTVCTDYVCLSLIDTPELCNYSHTFIYPRNKIKCCIDQGPEGIRTRTHTGKTYAILGNITLLKTLTPKTGDMAVIKLPDHPYQAYTILNLVVVKVDIEGYGLMAFEKEDLQFKD